MNIIRHPLRKIFIASFFYAIHTALSSYINSSFLSGFINKKDIGLIYSIAAIFTILGLLLMPKILKKIGNYKNVLIYTGTAIISLLVLAFAKSALVMVPFFIIYLVTLPLTVSAIDEFTENYSKIKNTGNIRGTFLTVINSAWVIAPIITGFILSEGNYQLMYLITSFLMLVAFAIFYFKFKNYQDPEYKESNILGTIKEVYQNKKILKIYKINFALQFFYSLMVIYTPIYLNQYMSFAWDKIGIIFTIMLLPFVLLQLPLGRLADKIGEKLILNIGILIIGISTLSIYFIKSPEIIIWGAILFATRVGASAIEVMSETYFFKQIDSRDSEIISFYRSAYPLAYIIAPISATVLLLCLPFNSIFLILGLIMLSVLYLGLTLKK